LTSTIARSAVSPVARGRAGRRALLATTLYLLSAATQAQGIYACVDSKGRKITSDRPIAECVDREQKELNPSGTVRRKLGPTLTAEERVKQEEQEKLELEERNRLADEKRRDRALLSRYPNKQAHDAERAAALTQVDGVIKAANKRVLELIEQRKTLNLEMEFYKKDPTKAPPTLKRQVEENDSSMALQKRFLVDQDREKVRVNARFDEELVKLKSLWGMRGGI
jgi:Domain of unknown function (DUF4124)